jgi:membrane protease YdiL (CAAX protease family)
MSDAAQTPPRRELRGGAADHVLTALLVGAAAAALVELRLRLIPVAATPRIAALAALYAGILAACLLVPTPRRAGRPWLALGVGIGGVCLATVAAGPPIPHPYSSIAIPLSLLAAVAEEALFRRTLYDALAPRGTAVAIIVSAVLFAAIHVPLYGVAALPIDLGAGILFGWQRWAAGTWRVPAATHGFANLIGIFR